MNGQLNIKFRAKKKNGAKERKSNDKNHISWNRLDFYLSINHNLAAEFAAVDSFFSLRTGKERTTMSGDGVQVGREAGGKE